MNLLRFVLFLLSATVTISNGAAEEKKYKNWSDTNEIITRHNDYKNGGNRKKAEIELLNGLNKHPESKELVFAMAKYYESEKMFRYPYMEKYYFQYLSITSEVDSNRDKAIYSLVEYYVATSVAREDSKFLKSKNAELLLSKISNKIDSPYRLYLGLVQMVEGNFVEGISNIKNAPIEKISYLQTKWVYNGLGYTLIKNGKFQEAEEALKIAVVIDPLDKFAHVNLGFVFRNLGEKKKACEEYKAALEIDPKYSKALQGYSECEKHR